MLAATVPTISRVRKSKLRCLTIVLYLSRPVGIPGMVKPSNIRHTYFSHNPKIAQFLKAYNYVKEFGEGVDRVCRELEANGTPHLSFHLDDFILKITVSKVTERVIKKDVNVTEKVIKTHQEVIEKVIEKAVALNEKLTENRISIIKLIIENPYISKSELSKHVGISENSISRNIEAMRDKYLRRVGPNKSGFWEIID